MPKFPKIKRKRLNYRRAIWEGDVSMNLEKELRSAHDIYNTVAKRKFGYSGGEEIKCARYDDSNAELILLQIAAYAPNQPTSTISKNNRAKSATIAIEPAPNGKDYLDGDIFILVQGNHVILCPSGVQESVASNYFRKMLTKVGIDITAFKLEKVAKTDKIKMLQKEGVKEVRLGASLYDASLEQINKEQPKISSLKKVISEQIQKIFAQDDELKEIVEDENLNIKLSISFDGREAMKHKSEPAYGVVGKNRLLSASKQLLSQDEDQDGFVILTGKGNEISQGDIKVSEMFNVKTLGKSLNTNDAWEQLKNYASQLKQTGVLEQ